MRWPLGLSMYLTEGRTRTVALTSTRPPIAAGSTEVVAGVEADIVVAAAPDPFPEVLGPHYIDIVLITP